MLIRRHARLRQRNRKRRWGGRRPGSGRPPHPEGKLVRKIYSIETWHVNWLNWYAAQHGCRSISEAFRHLIDTESERRNAEYFESRPT